MGQIWIHTVHRDNLESCIRPRLGAGSESRIGAEFVNLKKKWLKMVYLKSNPSFLSLGQITLAHGFGVYYFNKLLYFAVVKTKALYDGFLLFSKSGSSSLLCILCLSAILKELSPETSESESVLCASFLRLICWGCSRLLKESSMKTEVLLCSLHLRHWNERLAHRNHSVSIYWTNEFFSLPSFNKTDTIRQRERYYCGQIFRNSCHS